MDNLAPQGSAPRRTPRTSAAFRFALVAGGVAIAAGLWINWRRGPGAAPSRMSTADLTTMLADEEEPAMAAQAELLRRPEGTSVAFWEQRFSAPTYMPRYAAVEALTRGHTAESDAALARGLEDPDSKVRIEAVHAFQDTSRSDAMPVLLSALRDDDSDVREAAALALRFRKDPRSVPGLIRALRDGDRNAAVLASSALRHITGQRILQSYRDTPEQFDRATRRWDEWWSTHASGYRVDPRLAEVAPTAPTRHFPAPDFSVTTVGGDRWSLKSMHGKTVLVNFWGVLCSECIAELPDLQRAIAAHSDRGVVAIGLEAGTAKAPEIAAFAKQHQVGMPVASAPDSVLQDYGHIHGVPVTFLIDKHGEIRYQWDGQRDFASFDAALNRVLSEP